MGTHANSVQSGLRRVPLSFVRRPGQFPPERIPPTLEPRWKEMFLLQISWGCPEGTQQRALHPNPQAALQSTPAKERDLCQALRLLQDPVFAARPDNGEIRRPSESASAFPSRYRLTHASC